MDNKFNLCSYCGTIEHHTLTCNKCENRIYCNLECLERDWYLKKHSTDCNNYNKTLTILQDFKKYEEWKEKGSKFGILDMIVSNTKLIPTKLTYYTTLNGIIGFLYTSKTYTTGCIPVFDIFIALPL